MHRKFSRPDKKDALNEKMMRVKLVLLLLAAGLIPVSAEELKYLEVHKSAPIEVNGLEFVAATQSQWIGKVGGWFRPIEIQLWITNRSGHDLVFRTSGTFRVNLKDSDRKEIPQGGGRNGYMFSPSVLIHAGDTYCLSRKAELRWKVSGGSSPIDIPDGKGGTLRFKPPKNDFAGYGWEPDGKSRALFYWDGTGSVAIYQLLNPGSFGLSFSIGTSEKEAATENKKLGGLPVWSGDLKTKEVPFEIIEELN